MNHMAITFAPERVDPACEESWLGWIKKKLRGDPTPGRDPPASPSKFPPSGPSGPGKPTGPPPRDPSYSTEQRWKGVICDAVIEGVMLPDSVTSMPVFTNGNRQEWHPFDWKTVSQLQRAVTDYGTDNKVVRMMVQSFLHNQNLVPLNTRNLMELVLTSTEFRLFKDEWKEKCEVAMMSNLGNRPSDDPLRYVKLDQLMGEGQYWDVLLKLPYPRESYSNLRPLPWQLFRDCPILIPLFLHT